jgi:hypothetical protein
VAVDVGDGVAQPSVEPGGRARDIVVGHNRLLPCELTATAASGPHYRRAEWPVSTSSGPRRRVTRPGRVVRGAGVGIGRPGLHRGLTYVPLSQQIELDRVKEREW